MKWWFIILSTLVSSTLFSQTIFWTENFEGNPCTSGCDPSLISWTTTNTGANSASANKWYVSSAEVGQAANVCGSGSGTDESLHVGSTTLGDIGAAYDASRTTNKRVESPTINCTGYSGITVNFNYISYGEPGFDFATFLYFDGTNWNNITNPMPVTTCCNGGVGGAFCNGSRQGYWTAFSVGLPAGANNNPNVKIGFNWTNDGSSGSDPSFAVDDITLSYNISLPIELLYFSGNPTKNGNIKLEWVTESEINNDYFTIERSVDGEYFTPIATIQGEGNSSTSKYYSVLDYSVPINKHIYYRLKQTDFNGEFSYSDIISVRMNVNGFIINQKNNNISVNGKDAIMLEIYDISGKKVFSSSLLEKTSINTASFKAGIYILKVIGRESTFTKKMKF